MRTNKPNTAQEINQIDWQNSETFPRHQIPNLHWQWLCHAGSLTARLRRRWGARIEFCFIAAGWGEVTHDERQVLDLQNEGLPWVREIEWRFDGELWIAARTIIPRQGSQQWQEIGAVSIGDYLFQPGGYQREAIQLATWAPDQWGRRSLFSRRAERLLVCETFLPAFFLACAP